ncbi:MAG: hypothetical protein ABIP51_18265 [Bacteroidia bacterium]
MRKILKILLAILVVIKSIIFLISINLENLGQLGIIFLIIFVLIIWDKENVTCEKCKLKFLKENSSNICPACSIYNNENN